MTDFARFNLLAALAVVAAANAIALFARPGWVFAGLLIAVAMPFAGAIVMAVRRK